MKHLKNLKNKYRVRNMVNKKRYATIKRGKVKLDIGSKQDKFLHSNKLPYSHVTIKNGKKKIKRY